MSRHASKLAMLVAFATTLLFVAAVIFATPAVDAQLDAYSQVAPELAQPDKVKTSAADAADAAAAKAAALAALDRALPVCARASTAKKESNGKNASSSSCALVRPLAEDPADDPAWSQFEASYAGTVWLPPAPAGAKTLIKAAGSYYQVRVESMERERERQKTPAAKTSAAVFFPFFFFVSSFLSFFSFALTTFLSPPPPPFQQIAKLPLSRSACAPGSAVAARLVLRLPAANGTKYTAGLLPKVNELADSRTVRRCVLSVVNGLATPQEASAAASSATTFAASCTECNTLVAAPPSSSASSSSSSGGGGYGGYGDSSNNNNSEGIKLCPSTPGVWYVDTLPLRVPTAAAGWCDDDGGDEAAGEGGAEQKKPKARLPENDAYAAFVVNAGSAVDVAFFDIVPRAANSAGPGAPSA